MKIPFRKKPTVAATADSAPKLTMCEIYADAPPNLPSFTGELSAIKDKLIAEEGVHPFAPSANGDAYAQIDRCRLAPKVGRQADGKVWNKHCYGLFDEASGKLLAAVYVKLANIELNSRGKVADDQLQGNVNDAVTSAGQWIEAPNTAFFYTITSMRDKKQSSDKASDSEAMNPKILAKLKRVAAKQVGKALGKAVKLNGADLDIGKLDELTPQQRSNAEQLIHFAAAEVSEQYGVRAHSTLSPVRTGTKPEKMAGLRPWLREVLSDDAKAKRLLTKDERQLLKPAQGSNYFEKLEHYHEQRSGLPQKTQKDLTRLMEDLAIYYIAHERDPQKPHRPRDSVTGFHIPNGAKLANVHYLPPEQSTPLDTAGSFGVMVNYRYELDLLAARKANFKREAIVPLGLELSQRYQARLGALGEKADVEELRARTGVQPHAELESKHHLALGTIDLQYPAAHAGKLALVQAQQVAEK